MDLVGRNLALGGGTVVEDYFALVASDLDQAQGLPVAERRQVALALLRDVTATLRGASGGAAGAAAVDYLRFFALVAIGWMWTRMAAAARSESSLYQEKRAVADFFVQRVLPQVQGLAASTAAGDESIMALDAAVF
ncbi:acyl-CoA dehydrogenase C-terminal domain-containing protein [Sphingomonas sp. Root710]|uniref:acyl-CoA dehydrogenase C-terminal domain-containing protein n=1 Tax=Sphingomonas sp. Root710 TaxID=1736594 RepID=UPI0009E774A9|nr:acyl-CoA dehydrogenase C-terminal domain-containing protein [Sphingomonas sp. Root710]